MSASPVGVPAPELAPTVSPWAITLTVAVISPERFIVQASELATQPAHIAKYGTSGMPISTAKLGSVQPPEAKLWV